MTAHTRGEGPSLPRHARRRPPRKLVTSDEIVRKCYVGCDPLDAARIALGVQPWDIRRGRSPFAIVGVALIAVLPFCALVLIAAVVLPREFAVALALTLLGVVVIRPYDRLVKWTWQQARIAHEEHKSLTNYLMRLLSFYITQPYRVKISLTETPYAGGFLMDWQERRISHLTWYRDVLRFRLAERTLNNLTGAVAGYFRVESNGEFTLFHPARAPNWYSTGPRSWWRTWRCRRALRCVGLLLRRYNSTNPSPDAPVQTLARTWFGGSIHLPEPKNWPILIARLVLIATIVLTCLSV